MKWQAWWPLLVALVVPGGCVIAALEYWRRRREREHAPDYVRQISILAPERPMALPAVKPLQGVKVPAPEPVPVPKKDRRRRQLPQKSARVTRFEKRMGQR